MSREPLQLRSSDGLRLEGLLDAATGARSALVLCHPHPRMGGTMNAPLLETLTEKLVDDDWAVLRFNFRGIGGSEGESSMGIEEVADAQGAVAFMRNRFDGVPLAIAGWSFGAAVAVRAATEDDSLSACVAIAPAIKEKPGVTAGLPPARELDLGVPLLIIVGENDEVVEAQDCKSWAEDIPHAETVVVKAANHFFWAQYEKLAEQVTTWLGRHR